jgi:8-oxo-dGTP pyrophosphatase MutT (NUDIX family)
MNGIKFTEVFNTPFFSIESTTEEFSDKKPYYRINTKDSVICCLMDAKDNLLLAEQFRPNLGYNTLEFPAGGIECGETPHDAAKREIKEEMGVNCNLIYLGSYRLMMNRTVNKEHLFIGLSTRIISHAEQGIQTRVIPRREFSSYILDKKIEQLAALGILNLIDIRFNINFLKDLNVISAIWEKK